MGYQYIIKVPIRLINESLRVSRRKYTNEKGEVSPPGERRIIVPLKQDKVPQHANALSKVDNGEKYYQGKAGRMSPDLRFSRQADAGDDDADGREHGADGVDGREQAVAEGDDGEGQAAHGVEDQQQLPGLDGEVRVEEADGGGDQRREPEVHRQRDGPVPDQPGPAGDEGQDRPVLRARQLERPVVRPRRGRVPRGQLAQRERYALG